jgi:hypothetical protein
VDYQLPPRSKDNDYPPRKELDYGKIGSVFIFFGLLSLLTALIFSSEREQVFNSLLSPSPILEKKADPAEAGEKFPARNYALIGPFDVKKPDQVLKVTVDTILPQDAWSFVEGEVLDAEKDFLFSFGKELWHETGYDEDGRWDETDNGYEMKLAIPQVGRYYLNIKTQGNHMPDRIRVAIARTLGSSIPHLVFGIFTLLIGIALNEIQNLTITRIMSAFK